MVKEEILAGLKEAVSKGESLNKAMMSFYNSGYTKEDIEEAARALETPRFPSRMVPPGYRQQMPQPYQQYPTQPPARQQPQQYYQQPPAQPQTYQQPKPTPQQAPVQPLPQQPKPNLPTPLIPSLTIRQPKQEQESAEAVEHEFETFTAPKPIVPHEVNHEQAQAQYPPLEHHEQHIQRVSSYDARPSPMSAVAIFFLVFLLLVLVGALIAVFLFKDELSTFFGSLL